MLRRAALLLATLFACGCQGPGQSLSSNSPFGNQRIAPPGTNSYPKPDIYYPGGANPAGATSNLAPVGASTGTSSTFGPGRVFNSQPAGAASPAAGANWRPGSIGTNGNSLFDNNTSTAGINTAPGITPASFGNSTSTGNPAGVRFGDTRAPHAQSSIRLNGMPVNDATRTTQPKIFSTATGSGIPEITDYPRATGFFPPAPPATFSNNISAPYGVGPVPYYAPPYGITPPATANSSSGLGWKTKANEGGSLR